MINLVRDMYGDSFAALKTALSLAAINAYRGDSSLVLQFVNNGEQAAEDVIFKEDADTITGSEMHVYYETGMDALISKATMNKLTKEEFYDLCEPYLQNKHFDVAKVSTKANFLELLQDKKEAVIILLKAASLVYNQVFIISGEHNFIDLFEGDVETLNQIIDRNIWCVRQGRPIKENIFKKVKIHNFAEGTDTEYDPQGKAYVILTRYSNLSEFNIGLVTKDAKKRGLKMPIFPLSEPIAMRDNADKNRLGLFFRKAKIANVGDTITSETNEWNRQVTDILDSFGTVVQKLTVFSRIEGDEDEVRLLPKAPVKEILTAEQQKKLDKQAKENEKKRVKEEAEAAKKRAKEVNAALDGNSEKGE